MDLGRFWAAAFLALLALSLSGIASAGANVDIRNVEAPSFVEKGETVRVKATIVNTADEEAHQMEVKAKGFDQVKEENLWNMDPGEEDTISFYLEAPGDEEGTHDIQVSVQSRDDDGRVIGGEKRNISIDVGDEGAVVDRRGDLKIKSVTMPGTVTPGGSFEMEVEVRNTGDRDMNRLHVSVGAFGRTITEEAGTLRDRTTRTVSVKVDVPSAARGREEARIETSTSRGSDELNTTISISDVQATMQLRQTYVTVGDHVTVSGILSRRNARADLIYAGRFEAPVFSDNTGHFTHTIIPERPGTFTVALVSGNNRIERVLRVEPRLEVASVSSPTRVGLNSFFDVCGLVSRASQGQVELRLLVDGQVRKSANVAVSGETEHCFPVSLTEEGDHTLRFEASADGVTATESVDVSAIKSGLSAAVFPDRLTLTSGQAGVFQVRIENDGLESRQFDVEVDGFENADVSFQDAVSLGRGESKTSFVRVVPPERGTYSATVTVSEGGTVHAENAVNVIAVENPALKNPIIGGAARQVLNTYNDFQGLNQRQKWVALGLLAAFIVVLAVLWRRRDRHVIEPQY